MSNRTPTHPGAILREDTLPALGWTADYLAARLGVASHEVRLILSENRAISPEVALRLARLFGNGPDLWLDMQRAHDLAVADFFYGQSFAEIVPVTQTEQQS